MHLKTDVRLNANFTICCGATRIGGQGIGYRRRSCDCADCIRVVSWIAGVITSSTESRNPCPSDYTEIVTKKMWNCGGNGCDALIPSNRSNGYIIGKSKIGSEIWAHRAGQSQSV